MFSRHSAPRILMSFVFLEGMPPSDDFNFTAALQAFCVS